MILTCFLPPNPHSISQTSSFQPLCKLLFAFHASCPIQIKPMLPAAASSPLRCADHSLGTCCLISSVFCPHNRVGASGPSDLGRHLCTCGQVPHVLTQGPLSTLGQYLSPAISLNVWIVSTLQAPGVYAFKSWLHFYHSCPL